MDTYSHILPDMQQRPSDKLELMLFYENRHKITADFEGRHTIGSQNGQLNFPVDKLPMIVFWLGGRDSNPDSQIQSLESYHWTTSQQEGS
jgi:hypothetical protein